MSALDRSMVAQGLVDSLRAQVQGAVFVPGDAGYDENRRAWNLLVDQHPAVILRASSPADVVAGVRFAREAGLGIAVQSTGHGPKHPADNSLLIVMSELTGVRVDVETQTAWVEGGAKWGHVLPKTQEFGLAPLLGSSPDVGVVGYTLGGGIGWLARKYGLAADSVHEFEVVTADGRLLRASPLENSELFWALHGGGGSFGVITALRIQLYPVTSVYGGNLIYPGVMAKEVVTAYRDWIATLPEEFTTSIVIMNVPPIPQAPEPLRGQSVVMVRGLYCGPVEQGEALLGSLQQKLPPPMMNAFRRMPFAEVATVSNDPEDPMSSYTSGAWLRELSDEAIDTLIAYGVGGAILMTEVRHVGGAMARVEQDSNAFGHRHESLVLSLIGGVFAPEMLPALEQQIAAVLEALKPVLSGGVYMNFLDIKESSERIQDAFSPDAFRRLKTIKAHYDPDNLLRFSMDIPPQR